MQPAFVLPVRRAILCEPTPMGRVALRVTDPARPDVELFRLELTRDEADGLARSLWGTVGLMMQRERSESV